MTTTPPGTTAAFFDVDETLVTCKSMLSFLAHHHRERGFARDEHEQALALLADLVRLRGSRAESNRAYYRLFAGQRIDQVIAAGRRWFAEQVRDGLFHEPALSRLRAHREAGELIVLVSGSFRACLDPIAAHVGAHVVLGSEPDVLNGRYTGDVREVRIGEGKAVAVRRLCADRGIRAEDSHAYADHATDLELLEAVGNPVVVGADPVLRERARLDEWQCVEGIGT